MQGLSDLVEGSEFTVIASVIDKNKHLKRYGHNAHSPYELSLLFCMERLYHFLDSKTQIVNKTHIILECRGKKEDDELELAFRRFCGAKKFPFEPIFAHKQNNSAGLQLADLVARPIGRHVMNSEQPNRAYDILKKKFYKPNGSLDGWGLKIFPN